MSLRIDRCGWGAGLIDPDPPILNDGDPARRSRELALRQMLEVLSDGRLVGALRPEFVVGGDDHAHARFVRLVVLIRRLVDHELPALRRLLRCQTAMVAHTSTAPEGGRVDFLGTLRRAPAAELIGSPAEWLVQRTHYFTATPVNQLVAAILHHVAAAIAICRRHVALHWRLLPREDDILHRAARALRRFFEITPLGTIPRDSLRPVERMIDEAARRRAEFARVAPLVDWWQEFQRYDLATLRSAADEDAFTSVSVHACYELVCTTALVLALRDRCAVLDGGPGDVALRFRAASGVIALQLGADLAPVWLGRTPTVLIELQPDGRPAMRVIVEARNAAGSAAQEIAGRMVLLRRAAGDRDTCVLLTPGDGEPSGFEDIRWRSFARPLCSGAAVNPVTEWQQLLDELLDPIEEGA